MLRRAYVHPEVSCVVVDRSSVDLTARPPCTMMSTQGKKTSSWPEEVTAPARARTRALRVLWGLLCRSTALGVNPSGRKPLLL